MDKNTLARYRCDKCGRDGNAIQLWDYNQSALNLKCKCGGTFRKLK